jgi:hypothetical protein
MKNDNADAPRYTLLVSVSRAAPLDRTFVLATTVGVLSRLQYWRRCDVAAAPAAVDLIESRSSPGIVAYGGRIPWRVELLPRPVIASGTTTVQCTPSRVNCR